MPVHVTRDARVCTHCRVTFTKYRSARRQRFFCSRQCYRDARAMMPTDIPGSPTDVAWAAGLLDGEGSIGLNWRQPASSHTPWWHLQVTVTNTHKGALERFVAVLGRGRFYAKRPIDGRQPVFYVSATGTVAATILTALLPHLTIKRDQAMLALEARGIGLRTDQIVSEESWLRMIEIENAIKALNGINYAKQLATRENRPQHRTPRPPLRTAEDVRTMKRNSTAVRRAIVKGKLTRPSICEECGENQRQLLASHPDNTRPLDVRWLCRSCASRRLPRKSGDFTT